MLSTHFLVIAVIIIYSWLAGVFSGASISARSLEHTLITGKTGPKFRSMLMGAIVGLAWPLVLIVGLFYVSRPHHSSKFDLEALLRKQAAKNG